MPVITLSYGGISADIWTLGAAVNDLRLPDRDGRVASVVLGYANRADRLAGRAYCGEIVGPVANRIGADGYSIDQVVYRPELNEPAATLHSGSAGFHRADWTVRQADARQVVLGLDWASPDGGFPGPIRAEVRYRLDDAGLSHRIVASAPVATNLNIVSHPYFNLSGGGVDIGDHELTVPASRFLPVDDNLMPLADAPWSLDGSALDLRAGVRLGDVIAADDPQIRAHAGLDHAYILDQTGILDGQGWRLAARLYHPGSGRQLTISTDQAALQIYTGQGLDDARIAHPGGAGGAYAGVALETEAYPGAANRPDFESILVRPGEEFDHTTIWRFAVIDR